MQRITILVATLILFFSIQLYSQSEVGDIAVFLTGYAMHGPHPDSLRVNVVDLETGDFISKAIDHLAHPIYLYMLNTDPDMILIAYDINVSRIKDREILDENLLNEEMRGEGLVRQYYIFNLENMQVVDEIVTYGLLHPVVNLKKMYVGLNLDTYIIRLDEDFNFIKNLEFLFNGQIQPIRSQYSPLDIYYNKSSAKDKGATIWEFRKVKDDRVATKIHVDSLASAKKVEYCTYEWFLNIPLIKLWGKDTTYVMTEKGLKYMKEPDIHTKTYFPGTGEYLIKGDDGNYYVGTADLFIQGKQLTEKYEPLKVDGSQLSGSALGEKGIEHLEFTRDIVPEWLKKIKEKGDTEELHNVDWRYVAGDSIYSVLMKNGEKKVVHVTEYAHTRIIVFRRGE